MPLPVSLREIAGEIGSQGDETSLYLDRRSGEIVAVFESDLDDMNEVDPEELESSDDYVALPDKTDIHEWDLMDQFSLACDEKWLRDELRSAIRGSGAFRMFRAAIRHHGLERLWYQFRDVAIARIAAACLDEHGVEYVVDVEGFADDSAEDFAGDEVDGDRHEPAAGLANGEIRTAGADDVERLLPLVEAFHRQDGYPFDPRVVRRVLARLLSSTELGWVGLVEDGADVVGYCVLCFGYSIEFEGRDAFVDELFVRNDRRGAGIGARLLEAAERAAREAGVAALHLEVERNNERARAMYRRRGYADHDRSLLTKWVNRREPPV